MNERKKPIEYPHNCIVAVTNDNADTFIERVFTIASTNNAK